MVQWNMYADTRVRIKEREKNINIQEENLTRYIVQIQFLSQQPNTNKTLSSYERAKTTVYSVPKWLISQISFCLTKFIF